MPPSQEIERGGKFETIKSLGIATTALISAYLISSLAFTYRARKEIGEIHNWTCTCGKCFHDGYHVQAAHYPELHQRGWDDNPEHGRILCTECHIVEELQRGNTYGARLLWENQTIRTIKWIQQNGGEDDKAPFEYYQQLSQEVTV